IKKFQDYFNLPTKFNATNLALVDQLFASLKQRHFSLDLNTAGLYKPYCNETYPYSDLILRAQAAGIPLI
ncbi:histidinol-phosphatase, partial [Lactiplantibacillus plantarum]